MTHRILTPLTSLALAISVKVFSKRRSRKALEPVPEPIVWNAAKAPVNAADYSWMFEAAPNAIARETGALQSEMSRVSGALGSLRNVLSALAAHAPITDDDSAQIPMNALWTEDALFEGESMAAIHNQITEDSDLFLETPYADAAVAEYSQAA